MGAFVLWRLSAHLPGVRAEETVSNPLPQSRETSVCSSVSSPGHTVSVSVRAAINCSVLGCAPLRSAPSPASRSGHVSALCASKTASRSQFARGNPPLWVSTLGAALKSFPQRYRSASLCPSTARKAVPHRRCRIPTSRHPPAAVSPPICAHRITVLRFVPQNQPPAIFCL